MPPIPRPALPPQLRRSSLRSFLCLLLGGLMLATALPSRAMDGPSMDSTSSLSDAVVGQAQEALLEMHPEEAERIRRGVEQAAALWRPEDGDGEAFRAFVQQEFIPRGETLDLTFQRLEFAMERLDGYMTSLVRDLRRGVDLEIGPLLPVDRRLGGYSPAAHVVDDLFANKIAFVVLLNFPHSSLDERRSQGAEWSRERWAQERLTDVFSTRVPAAAQQAVAGAMADADSYINGYNLHLHHVLTEDGQRLFPEGLRLISHWGLRDELKARYADAEGLPKQRLIQQVFEKIVAQEIPAAVIDEPRLDWTPATGVVAPAPEAENAPAADPSREPDTRYQHWLEIFRAQRQVDAHDADNPSHMARRFNVDREIPEERVRQLFESILSSPLGQSVGELAAQRLGRPLEPFDIWYNGFVPGGGRDEDELSELTRARYPSADAFAADLPRILDELGFPEDRAAFLAERIVVEPSRGAGHAFGPARPDDNAHLRTRIGEGGMDYKGYNIAVHELGHNVEQVFSIAAIDHTLLQGVPNTAFTEALAFVFQNRDLELLGLDAGDPDAEHLVALDTFWNTREIAGVALVDMAVWHWMYEHPDATPAEMRQAVLEIAQDVWNRYFADVFGIRDQTLLAVYSHMVDGALYTPDYPLGHLIAYQIERHFAGLDGPLGPEFERITRIGRLTPDLWMRQAVGSPLSAQPLLDGTEEAVEALASH
ncbi:MAG: hypothetical protein SX243_16550 [Acidobacteriota bacterium]|nr:hypothetical protein [Acidobacteriota bacterium]